MLLNYRRVNDKFSISGGWRNIYDDTDFLVSENIVAVLDLQYLEYDEQSAISVVTNALAAEDIEHHVIRFADGGYENELYTRNAIDKGVEIIEDLVERFPDRKQRILIKCAAGISRSTTMFIAYHCEKNRWTYDEGRAYLWDCETKLAQEGLLEWEAHPDWFFVYVLGKMYGRTEYTDIWKEVG